MVTNRTKAWLTEHMDNVFAFPNIVRFSWGTVEPFLDKAVKVEWPHDKELDKVGQLFAAVSILYL